MMGDTPMISCHVAMSFGATASVHAWNRASALLQAVMRRYLRIHAFRYVDDFFVAQRKGQGIGAAGLAAMFLASVGFNDDPAKRQQLRARMGVLGAEVTLSWMRRMVTIQTSE